MGFKDYIKKRPLVADKWHQVKSIMQTHLMGKPPELLFRTRRPLESSDQYALSYRLENFQPITKQPFNAALSAIIETAKHINVSYKGVTSKTSEYLQDTTITVMNKEYSLKDYTINYIGRMAEHDPNAALVVRPIHPVNELIPDYREEIPNFGAVQNKPIELGIELISSDFIHKISSHEIIYNAGEWVYSVKDENELTKPYFYWLTAKQTSLIIPIKTTNGFKYEVIDYYFNDLEKAPFTVIGYNAILEDVDGTVEEYFEATYSGAVAIGNEVLGVKSDSQIVDTRFTYPEKYMHMERCGYPGCIKDENPESPYKGLFVNYIVTDEESTCTTCAGCGGSGQVAPDTSPLGTHFVAKSDLWDENGKFTPLIGFVTPPLDSPEYLAKQWRLSFEEMTRALFLTNQNMTNQSGESKSYDVRQKVTVISNAVDNIYRMLTFGMNTIQGYFREEQDITATMPKDYNIKTSQDITQELSNSKDTSSVYTSELTRELLLNKFGNDEQSIKIVDFLELNDKLFGMTIEEILKLKAIYGNSLTPRDQVIHDKGAAILKRLALNENFLTLSDEQLLNAFNVEVDKIQPIVIPSPIA